MLDRTGTFRGTVIEWGVSTTAQKKLPQFVIRARLDEYYDQQEGAWFDYTDQEAEISAYLCLYGAIKSKGGEIGPTLSLDQVKKVFEWDGASMAALANGDYSELQIQLRISDNTYEDAKTPYQVDWIDEYNADPIRQLQKLGAAELKDLDKQFANLLTKKSTKAVSAKSSAKPAVAKPTTVEAPAVETPEKPITAAEKKKILKKKSDRIKADAEATAKAKAETEMAAPPEASEVSAPEVSETPAPVESTSCTKIQAWEGILEMRDQSINDGTVKELWNSAIEEVAGPEAVTKVGMEDVTDEQWHQVQEIVLKDCAKF